MSALPNLTVPVVTVGSPDLKGDILDAYLGAYKDGQSIWAQARGVTAAISKVPEQAEAYASKRAGDLITGIDETTRDSVQGVVSAAARNGLSDPELADQLSSSFAFSPERAQLIARTESATAYNMGTLQALQDAGEDYVHVDDGDYDEECADADGQIWTIEEAMDNPIEHPACVRMFLPLDDDELAEVKSEEGTPDAIGFRAKIRAELRQAFYDESEARDSHGEWTDGGEDHAKTGAAWNKTLSDTTRNALKAYQHEGYKTLNHALRAGEQPSATKTLDRAFSTAPLTSVDKTVYRGMSLHDGFVPTVGAEFSDKGYVSTSSNRSVASDFDRRAAQYHKPDEIAMVRITVPKGSAAIDMKYSVKWLVSAEQELLLPRGSSFVITGVEGGHGKPWRIEATLKGRH